ncbi:YqaJ viral recombinase family protein [Mycolicibacterium psychrotolerans]|uniref:YqaJ viral recombinase family protein n=1 Tax=Mycolicibacterium psychrotolerans TaxID=216929 RepID=UPI003D667F67
MTYTPPAEGRIVRKGERGFLEPGSPEWAGVITPSKVAAILGLSRWESPFRLWHRMKGIVPPDPPKDAFDLGHDMESFAAARWLRRNPGWHVSPGEVQFHVPAGHFPFPAIGTIDRRASRGSWRRILEVKIARDLGDLERFGDDLTGDCPDDYAAQVTAQRMFVAATQSSLRWDPVSDLLVVGPYFNERIYKVDYDADVVSWVIDECSAFWESLQSDTPPDLDDQPATYECLKQLHPDIDGGSSVELPPALAVEYLEAKQAEKDAKAAAQGATNAVAAHMQSAQYANVGTLRVADRRSNGKGGVSLYAGRGVTPEKVREMEGTNA